MKERFPIDTLLVKGKKHKSVAMNADQLQRASENISLMKQSGAEVEIEVLVVGPQGERLVEVDDIWPAVVKVDKP